MKERVFQTYQDAYKYTRWYPMNEYGQNNINTGS